MPNFKELAKRLKVKKICYSLAGLYYSVSEPFSHEILLMDRAEAEALLNNFSPKPAGSSLTDNRIVEPSQCDLQIIVPAYNAEQYLKDCIDSILNQETQFSYQITLIDDGSNDKTPQIADTYTRDDRVEVIHQENKGFSGARNTGLDIIKGRYILFADADDMLPEKAIQSLMEVATEYDADIVEGASFNLLGTSLTKQSGINHIQKVDASKRLRGQPWGKVFRSSLFKNICFPSGFWFEDSINSFLIYPMAKETYLIPDYVYIYRIHPGSITHTAPNSPKCVDTYWITEQLVKEHEQIGLPNDEAYNEKILRQILLNAKRVAKMPEEVQQSIFSLSALLLDEHFKDINTVKRNVQLMEALKARDYGTYRLYCKTHSPY